VYVGRATRNIPARIHLSAEERMTVDVMSKMAFSEGLVGWICRRSLPMIGLCQTAALHLILPLGKPV